MKKISIQKLIKKWMGFIPDRNIPSILEQNVNFKTTLPDQHLNFNEWALRLRVSCFSPK
jgi:hypothetical protein